MSREQASSVPCPPDSPWVLTDLIMDHMRRRFHAGISPTTHLTSILPDVNIPTDMVCEADRMADILVRARKNPGKCRFIVNHIEAPSHHFPSDFTRFQYWH
jgi:predicted TIM-barrel fold metal-dependent hydrolase